MPFESGQSGNPSGRPQGTNSKNGKKLREMITDFLYDNFEQVQACFDQLKPVEKVRVYCDMMSFVLPRLRPVDDSPFERLTSEQLEYLLEQLKDAARKEIERVEAET